MAGTSEIVECEGRVYYHGQTSEVLLPGQRYSIEDDINKLFKAIELRNSRRVSGQQEGHSKGALDKSAMKRPMRMGSPQASGIGISESTSLKQALRGLCISQASEMAAVKKRSSKSAVSRHSEAGMKRPYCHPLNEGRGNLVEISLVPECNTSLTTVANRGRMEHIDKVRQSNFEVSSSQSSANDFKEKGKVGTPTQEEMVCVNDFCDLFDTGLDVPSSERKLHALDETDVQDESLSLEKEEHEQGLQPVSRSSIPVGTKVIRFAKTGPRLMRPFFRSKNFLTKKITGTAITQSSSSSPCNAEEICHASDSTVRNGGEDIVGSPEPSIPGAEIEVSSKFMDSSANKSSLLLNSYSRSRSPFRQGDEISGSRERGDLSQSSLSSYGDYSSTTSSSEDSYLSRSNRSGSRPHMSKDLRWKAIHSIQKQHGSLGLRYFKLLKKLGGGDIGNVYLSELIGTECLFAVKVMDNHLLTSRNKINRAQTEQEILQMLDHPFLPSLYAHFRTDKFSCLVMEYCPGGDLHVLRQKQQSRSFSEQSARFYIAEVLLALEYLHMLGVVYRDLKPENVLVREDGHIMLTDFDLSLRCVVNPTLLKSSTPVSEPPKKAPNPNSESSCIDPFCLHPSWQMSCFNPRFLSAASKTRKLKSELANQVSLLPQLIVEPTGARSNSFVGTHEYLAPEIIRGEGHGSAVDWWTLGIFAYELLYGKTPFKGPGNDDTLSNVVSQCLRFPAYPIVSTHARDLIRRLLQKEPESRLGSEKGAAEIKQHPFFDGLNWALIRCTTPPDVPKCYELGKLTQDKENGKCVKEKECRTIVEDTVFDMF